MSKPTELDDMPDDRKQAYKRLADAMEPHVLHELERSMEPDELLSTQATEDTFYQMLGDAKDRRNPHYGIPSNLLDSIQDALNQLPNTELDNADYPDTYTLAARLEYIVGRAKHHYWQRARHDAGMSSDYDREEKP
jgi:hypothetical protein